MITTLGYKIFFMFATINIGAMATFSLIIPETKGRSLEDMDLIFGSTTQETRSGHIAARETELDNESRGDTHHDDETRAHCPIAAGNDTSPIWTQTSHRTTTSAPTWRLSPTMPFKAEEVRKAMPYSKQYKTLLEFRKKLPVYAQLDEFYEVFEKHQVIILVGETGSGKTTQIPQFVAHSDLPHTKGKIVACTQPRRMSAISAAKRVADEMDLKLGDEVGYSIRFDDMTMPGTTFLKYATDGVLLREAIAHPRLERYSTIILDEVHERSLATDLLMGLLKGLLKTRADLKVIIMSASADDRKIQEYWDAPIFEFSGRLFPVEIFYTQAPEPDYLQATIRTVLMIHCAEEPGDILVFLTGEAEIEEMSRDLAVHFGISVAADPDAMGPLTCIPLYASLPLEQQRRIHDPPPPPRSIYGPPDGIVYVVDPGFSKQTVYNPRIRVESHLVSPISKASAQQRAGRAGRTRPGKCFRLYTEKDFVSELEEHTHPEILRSNLSSMVLILVKLGVKVVPYDLVRFDYVDAPAPESLMRALELLNYLAALDDEGNLTSLGVVMAEFPLEPQLAKMLIISPEFKCSSEILTLAAMLSVPLVWRRPIHRRREADAAKALLTVPGGDHLTLLNVYKQYKAIPDAADKNWAYSHYLSLEALSEADKARHQLERIMESFEIELVSIRDPSKLGAAIRQALVCGFFMQVAHKEGERGNYVTLKDQQVIFSHSAFPTLSNP
ncbi:P-loop containing nucleoside triphosphate hydrolase protein [Mycena leptocephala]|nr:P-loop containing nucleoside triphosphate hydrolase protein [Mycena leptocephala]